MSRIAYIAGYGRSGSTLLDILLGVHSKVTSTGEMGNITRRYRSMPTPCSCGSTLETCPFWALILSRTLNAPEYGGTEAMEATCSHLEAWPALFRLLSRNRSQRLKNHYANRMGRLMNVLFQETGSEILVDSSKSASPYTWRAVALKRLCGFDVRVIHLIRDGRAVMASKINVDNRAMRLGIRTANRAAAYRGLIGWIGANSFAFATGLLLGRDAYHLVRYESLIRHPERELNRLGRMLDLDLTPIVEAIQNDTPLRSGHLIAGNRMAVQKEIHLEQDHLKPAKLPAHLEALFFLAAWPVLILRGIAERTQRARRKPAYFSSTV